MLRLKDIVKIYNVAGYETTALDHVSLDFRKSEFVAILGPSGCGKTTMLNIIGGLDHYTSGDLIINNVSTKQYKDKDWDTYRNHKIGFVFQNYNLIPHQTILQNVELALTLSGVSKKERRERAIEALASVGLEKQINKKPNQMSGGQMQRVAIARALVNNPKILLADEPTGALDTNTSVQIMEVLKEVAKDRLVIMVTHNPELASTYANRIIKVLDGKVIDDTNPYDSSNEVVEEKEEIKDKLTNKKVSMSFFTALSLSLNNLFTKKLRTIMVAFAGSIGITGIALILSVSNGFQLYIDKVQEDTLSSYPISIEETNIDISSILESYTGKEESEINHDLDKIYSNDIMIDMYSTLMNEAHTNNLKEFKKYIESNEEINEYLTSVKYSYNINLNIYLSDTTNGVLQVNPSTSISDIYSSTSQYGSMSSTMALETWTEMIDNQELLDSQYDVVYGSWPKNYNQVVLVTDKNNEITDYTLYTLGIKDPNELNELFKKIQSDEKVEPTKAVFSYEDIVGIKYKLVLSADYYEKNVSGWQDITSDETKLTNLVNNGLEIEIVGIVRPKKGISATSIGGTIGYTKYLSEYVIEETNKRTIVKEQLQNKKFDVFTGMPFVETVIDANYVNAYLETLSAEEKAQYQAMIDNMGIDAFINMIKRFVDSSGSYEKNISTLGVADLESPSAIYLYPIDFESKDKISSLIEEYNNNCKEEGNDANIIQYTDYIGILLSSVTKIIDSVTYVLIAFVAISLVVSSIMIGVITYISVLERIKEIGILRSIGASKKDIARVFNAETVSIGFTSGVIGVVLTILLCIPINIILSKLANISNIAQLPVVAAFVLIAISIMLTLISGLIPSSIAAKKDPVEALRSE